MHVWGPLFAAEQRRDTARGNEVAAANRGSPFLLVTFLGGARKFTGAGGRPPLSGDAVAGYFAPAMRAASSSAP
jgi:hypothetical protein